MGAETAKLGEQIARIVAPPRLPTMPNPKMRVLYVVAIIAGFLGCVVALLFHELPPGANTPLGIAMGVLGRELAGYRAVVRRPAPCGRGQERGMTLRKIVRQLTPPPNEATFDELFARHDVDMIVRGALGTIKRQGVPEGAGPAMFEFGFWVARMHRWNELSRRTI